MKNESGIVKSQALLVHTYDDRCVAAAHEVHHTPNGFVLGAGRNLSVANQKSIVAALSRNVVLEMEIIPEAVLAFDRETVIWWRRACTVEMCLSSGVMARAVPSLIFRLRRGNLWVAAIRGTRRPAAATRLYHCGLPNIGAEGLWCSGGNALDQYPVLCAISDYEKMFFQSPFTHHGASPLKGGREGFEFWENEPPNGRFSNSLLVSMQNKRLGHWVTELDE